MHDNHSPKIQTGQKTYYKNCLPHHQLTHEKEIMHFTSRSPQRLRREQRTVELMIRLYCHKAEGHKILCPTCHELLDYALARLARCPHGANKPSCQHCPIHCYRPDMREKMRRVMRFSGPRMLLYHPITALRHLIFR